MPITYYGYNPCDREEIARLEDDGCPNILPVLDEQLPANIKIGEWGDYRQSIEQRLFSRVYSCERCGWFVWHPLSYCYTCGGRMRILKSYSSDYLKDHLKKYEYSDGGF